jgi:hypothetical protein
MSQSPVPGERPEPSLGYPSPALPNEDAIRLERPTLVFAGCIMAWVGSAIGLLIGAFLVTISSTAPALDTVAAADRADMASALHLVGGILLVWCPLVIVVAMFAYRGARWAALTLVGMAGAYLVMSIVSLATSSTAQGGLALLWTAVSAGLVFAPPTSRAWFNRMAASHAAAP